jgi:hypothetical protein
MGLAQSDGRASTSKTLGPAHTPFKPDFYNKIGPSRHAVLSQLSVAFGVKRTLVRQSARGHL